MQTAASTCRPRLANGGKILLEEYEIVGVGRMIKFEDTEGNIVAAMHYD